MNNLNYNQAIFTRYQEIYPNLKDFRYDAANDSLIYNGQIIPLNGYGLSRIDTVFFGLSTPNIFSYLRNEFYTDSANRDKVLQLFNQLVITDIQVNIITNFINKFKEKCQIYASDSDYFNKMYENTSIRSFIEDIIEDKKVIDIARGKAQINGSDAFSILWKYYNDVLDNTQNNQSNQNTHSNTLSQAMSLTRSKSGFSNLPNLEYENDQNIGIAGFTSIFIIIAVILVVGITIAIALMK